VSAIDLVTQQRSQTKSLTAGNLALSRALGDFEFKQNFALQPEQQIVTADPDITTHKIDGEEEFLVVACDGKSCDFRHPITIRFAIGIVLVHPDCWMIIHRDLSLIPRYLGLHDLSASH
jgi:hypothetical protein